MRLRRAKGSGSAWAFPTCAGPWGRAAAHGASPLPARTGRGARLRARSLHTQAQFNLVSLSLVVSNTGFVRGPLLFSDLYKPSGGEWKQPPPELAAPRSPPNRDDHFLVSAYCQRIELRSSGMTPASSPFPCADLLVTYNTDRDI